MNLTEILDYQLFQVGKYSLHVYNVLGVILLWIGMRILLSLVRRVITRSQRIDEGAKYSLHQLVRYALIIIALLVALSVLGVNISVLFVGSAALLVGIGFGLQHLFNDFISGIIILLDRTIKVQDVIEVDGIVCRVLEIKLRTTAVMTREDKYIILPNSVITQGKVVNWTYSHVTSRFEIKVQVAYSTDIPSVMPVLKQVVVRHPAVDASPEPSIRLTQFGDSGIEITIMFWCSEVFRVENIKSELRLAIFKALREANVVIPFPQRVVHMTSSAPARENPDSST